MTRSVFGPAKRFALIEETRLVDLADDTEWLDISSRAEAFRIAANVLAREHYDEETIDRTATGEDF